MNKFMLGAAAVALTLAVSPAFAADDSGVKLGLGGYLKGYMNYSSEDDIHSVDMLRDTEVHFGGETTLDNGLTVGAHIEALANGGDDFKVDESYIYFAGSWGRVNFGAEDGAAYLLQVAAPSADDNIDGIRQFVGPVTSAAIGSLRRDYANDRGSSTDKITYLSPVFSGLQAGASYSSDVSDAGSVGNDSNTTEGDLMEAAVRYEGMVGSVGLIAGAGYVTTDDEYNAWNAGVDLDIGAFGLGTAYLGERDAAGDRDTWALGADYTTGPFKLGASYFNTDLASSDELDRYAAGVVYSYGPGMTLRGSVGYTDIDTGTDEDATTVTIGTQVNF